MTDQGLAEPLTLRHTNVSNPSVIHAKPSQQSITASEDYYSLSSAGSDFSAQGTHTPTVHTAQIGETSQATPIALTRPVTPPEAYRTPFQSNTFLAQPSDPNVLTTATPQDAPAEGIDDEEVRKTPMHGEGKRRSSHGYSSDTEAGASALAGAAAVATAAAPLRTSGIKRKPVPSIVMEQNSPVSPLSEEFIDPTPARSSVLTQIEREDGNASPAADDTPYIRFAIDQLTRDEEVKGSRVYPDGATYDSEPIQVMRASPPTVRVVNGQREDREPQFDDLPGVGTGSSAVAGAGAAAALAAAAHQHDSRRSEEQGARPMAQWPTPAQPYNPRTGQRSPRRDDGPNVFIPVPNENGYHEPLNFLPSMLRPLSLILFILFTLVLLALLLLCAVWSLTHKGIFSYGYFGDANYFIFQYLPLVLGMLLLYWLVQIEVAVYRIAPYIAMANESSEAAREEGALLPLVPRTFFLPYFGHFTARQPTVGFFMLASWLQIFTIPLLASAFNVRSTDKGAVSTWRWVATAGAIWPVIGLYIILILTTSLLLVWLAAQQRRMSGTGLKWDPRSLADNIALLERSNALSLSEDEELRLDAPILGYWRTSRGSNEVFHSYGIADKPARRYSLENGRIREKTSNTQEPKSRFSDFEEDRNIGREQRHSREGMVPKFSPHEEDELDRQTGGRAIPWFLKTFFAILWAIIAVLLLAAFLVASYLPSTHLGRGFNPLVPSIVSKLGFSGTNFLYSFVPAVIGMICFLGLIDIDYAYRRVQPYDTLLKGDGALAERSLLLSYTADLPIFVQASSLANGHWRIAILSISSLLSLALPILAGGVFWAEFSVPRQKLLIWADKAAFYALTGFLILYALAIILATFPSREIRHLDHAIPRNNRARTFRDILDLVRMSRILDDVAFHAVTSKTDLVTRLLSAQPETTAAPSAAGRTDPEFAASKVSLADSMRGFGRARAQAEGAESTAAVPSGRQTFPRYGLGRYLGRDGREYIGIDRVRL